MYGYDCWFENPMDSSLALVLMAETIELHTVGSMDPSSFWQCIDVRGTQWYCGQFNEWTSDLFLLVYTQIGAPPPTTHTDTLPLASNTIQPFSTDYTTTCNWAAGNKQHLLLNTICFHERTKFTKSYNSTGPDMYRRTAVDWDKAMLQTYNISGEYSSSIVTHTYTHTHTHTHTKTDGHAVTTQSDWQPWGQTDTHRQRQTHMLTHIHW